MSLKLFRLLEIVLRTYSRQPPRLLLDSRLRLRLVLKLSSSDLQSLANEHNFSAPELTVFASGFKKKKYLTCLVIDHPLCLPLGKEVLRKEEEVLVIGKGGNCSNVIGIPIGDQQIPARALLFWIQDPSFNSIQQQLEAYLSLCQVFQGHLHMTFSCRDSESFNNWSKELSPSQGDQFVDFIEQGYFRILHERASRVTLEELSSIFRVEQRDWGQILVSHEGREGLVVWITLGRLPLLGQRLNLKFTQKGRAKLVPILESPLGFSVFKRKELLQTNLQELSTTTVIFNLREESSFGRREIQEVFQGLSEEFLTVGCLQREQKFLQETVCVCARVSEILQISYEDLVKKMLGS